LTYIPPKDSVEQATAQPEVEPISYATSSKSGEITYGSASSMGQARPPLIGDNYRPESHFMRKVRRWLTCTYRRTGRSSALRGS